MTFKILSLLALLFIQTFPDNGESLNDKIYKCHKEKLKCCSKDIETQYILRKQYINDVIQIRKNTPNDTIVLAESYPFECARCPARVEIFTVTKYQTFTKNYNERKFTGYSMDTIQPVKNFHSYNKDIPGQYLHYDFKKIILGLRAAKSLEKITKENNTEDCYDGEISIYTIIFPSNKLKCMKIRCWNDYGY